MMVLPPRRMIAHNEQVCSKATQPSSVHIQLWAAWLDYDWETPSACPHLNHSSAFYGPFSKSLLVPARVAPWVFLMPPTLAGHPHFQSATSPFKTPSTGYAREKKEDPPKKQLAPPPVFQTHYGVGGIFLSFGPRLLTFWALTFSILLFQHVLAVHWVS